MLKGLGIAAVVAILGTAAGALVAWIIGPLRWPGVVIAKPDDDRPGRAAVGRLVMLLFQGIALLIYVSWLARSLNHYLLMNPTLPIWPLLIVCCYVAVAPVLFLTGTARDVAVRRFQATVTGWLVLVGFLGFAATLAWPAVIERSVGWLPILPL